MERHDRRVQPAVFWVVYAAYDTADTELKTRECGYNEVFLIVCSRGHDNISLLYARILKNNGVCEIARYNYLFRQLLPDMLELFFTHLDNFHLMPVLYEQGSKV